MGQPGPLGSLFSTAAGAGGGGGYCFENEWVNLAL